VSDPTSSRCDFLTYALSLMRGHNAEHSDSLPVLDVSAMKHLAYVFDALVYFLRNSNQVSIFDKFLDKMILSSRFGQIPIENQYIS
jgi:E3 ubiquitin-protein ligase EDD1